MKHKVSELEGEMLDAAVAKSMHFDVRYFTEGRRSWWQCFDLSRQQWCAVPPVSTGWINGGPIIERERIELRQELTHDGLGWGATKPGVAPDYYTAEGATPLVAAMRAYVASKFGEEIDLP